MHADIITTAKQGSQEWLNARRNGLGSTDCAPALGVSRYKTPLELYQEKRGEVPAFAGNWFTNRGTAMEPVLRQHYCDTFGRSVEVVNGVLCHPQHKFVTASLDGFSLDIDSGHERIQEFKTSNTRKGWGEPGSDEIPQEYLMQVQHAMFVTGVEVADVGVSFGGLEPVYYLVEADAELHEIIIEQLSAFWRMVQEGIEPEPVSIEEKLRHCNIMNDEAIVATPDIELVCEDINDIKEQIKMLKSGLEDRQRKVQDYLIDNGGSVLCASDGRKIVSWNESKPRETFDSRRFKQEHPDMAQSYVKVGNPVRTFRTY